MKLRCYCCGEEIGKTIALVSLGQYPVSSAFVMKPEHVERVEDAEVELVVRQKEEE